MKILLDISFVGTAYCGYQVQPSAPTIQQHLNVAARQLFGIDCDIVGCSRTDSGVHAKQFFASVSEKGKEYIKTDIACDKIQNALNFYLPEDISVNHVSLVEDSFHPRYDVKSKEYLYCIWNSKTRNPFWKDRCWHYPRSIDESSFENMKKAAAQFVGTHDFAAYMSANSNVKSTVRTIYHATVERDGNAIYFRVSADGFLYNMVRILTGTLISVAEGKIDYSDIEKITLSRDRARAGLTAPSQGLYLNKVIY